VRKRELARAVATKLEARGLSGDLVELVIQATMDHLSDELARTGRLEYRDLGTFSVETYKARSIHNPKTGAIIQLPARRGVSFKPGLRLMSKLPPIAPAQAEPVETQVPRPIEGPAWVRLRPSPFIPEGKEFGPLFHQAIAMAGGRLVRLEGGRGLLDIDGYRYEVVDCRSKLHKARNPLAKFQEQVLTFIFWPTVTAAALARCVSIDSGHEKGKKFGSHRESAGSKWGAASAASAFVGSGGSAARSGVGCTGGLIQAWAGRVGGVGSPRTNRSGWAT
jgi:DNA-binding protein HU-beta